MQHYVAGTESVSIMMSWARAPLYPCLSGGQAPSRLKEQASRPRHFYAEKRKIPVRRGQDQSQLSLCLDDSRKTKT